MKNDIGADSPGVKQFLIGNDAIARGFIEAGIQVAASYPGTPSTEIMENLIEVGKRFNIYTEWSVNEKVAAEVAIAASIMGLRSVVSMKGVGVNVASEPFQAFTYMGAEGGIVLVSADDPSCHSSHTEQDNRFFAREAYMPIFEPGDPQEAKEMARLAVICSEEWHQPVMLRTTTTVSHSSSDVTLGKIESTGRKGHTNFNRQPARWVNLPINARRMRKELIQRMQNISLCVENLQFNKLEGDEDAEYGIVASGVAYNIIKECLGLLKVEKKVKLLKIGISYPLPVKMIEVLLRSVRKILVIEELEPFVEMQITHIANRMPIPVPVFGKGLIPLYGELALKDVMDATCKFLDIPAPVDFKGPESIKKEIDGIIPLRPPILCAGCGHRNAFFAINVIEKKIRLKSGEQGGGIIKPSDIGCYTLGYQPPLLAVDTNFCMGASVGISGGLSHVTDEKIVCTIGDSTFFHSGIPPLINAVFNNARITIIILENETTAMTGYQPHPGTGTRAGGANTKKIQIEDVVKACGVDVIKIVDMFNLSHLIDALEDCLRHEGVSVIVAKGYCAIQRAREDASKGTRKFCHVDSMTCTRCLHCMTKFGCPAMQLIDEKVEINQELCTGCSVCMDKNVCPKSAIKMACDS